MIKEIKLKKKKERKKAFFFFFYLFSSTTWHVGSYSPHQGSNSCPLQWKHAVSTTEPPGRSLNFLVLNIYFSASWSCHWGQQTDYLVSGRGNCAGILMNWTDAPMGKRSALSSQVSPHWNCQVTEENLGGKVMQATKPPLTSGLLRTLGNWHNNVSWASPTHVSCFTGATLPLSSM